MRSVIALSVSLLVSASAEHCDNILPPTFGVVDGQLVTSSQYCPGYMPHSYVQSTVPGWYLCGPSEVHGVVPKPDCSDFIPPAYPSATPLPTYSYPSASPYPTYSDMSASPYPTYSDMSASPYPTMESSMAPYPTPSPSVSPMPLTHNRQYIHYNIAGPVTGQVSFCLGPADCTPFFDASEIFPVEYLPLIRLDTALEDLPSIDVANLHLDAPGFLSVTMTLSSSYTGDSLLRIQSSADMNVETHIAAGFAPIPNRAQAVNINFDPTTAIGEYQLCFVGECTPNLLYTASNVEVQAALMALPAINVVEVSSASSTQYSVYYHINIHSANVPLPLPELVVYDHTPPTSVSSWMDGVFEALSGSDSGSGSSSGPEATPLPTYFTHDVEVFASSVTAQSYFRICTPWGYTPAPYECTSDISTTAPASDIELNLSMIPTVAGATVTLLPSSSGTLLFRANFTTPFPLFQFEVSHDDVSVYTWPATTSDIPTAPTYVDQIIEVSFSDHTTGTYAICFEDSCTPFFPFGTLDLESELEALPEIQDVSVSSTVTDSYIRHHVSFLDTITTTGGVSLMWLQHDLVEGSAMVIAAHWEIQELHISPEAGLPIQGYFSVCNTAASCTPNLPYDISAPSLATELEQILGFMVSVEQTTASADSFSWTIAFPIEIGNFHELYVVTALLEGLSYINTVRQGMTMA